MSFAFSIYDVCIFILLIIGIFVFHRLFNRTIFPWLVDKQTIDVEINPKWIAKKLQDKYYGFHDLDIVTVRSPLGLLPRFRLTKKERKLQFLIDEDTSIKNIDDVARLALAGKLKIKYGLWYPEKSAQWLSILNYMLDGKDIKIEATKWEEDKKPVDLSKDI